MVLKKKKKKKKSTTPSAPKKRGKDTKAKRGRVRQTRPWTRLTSLLLTVSVSSPQRTLQVASKAAEERKEKEGADDRGHGCLCDAGWRMMNMLFSWELRQFSARKL